MNLPIEIDNSASTNKDNSSSWDFPSVSIVCEHCNWAYLSYAEDEIVHCPHCRRDKLGLVSMDKEQQHLLPPPELMVPYKLNEAGLAEAVNRFTSGIPFAPSDLNVSRVSQRLKRIYLPTWLVDVDVNGIWKAEAGNNYQIVSHQESYDQNRDTWITRQVEETRTRWEPRVGKILRSFQNIQAPALEEYTELSRQLGEFDLKQLQPYKSEEIRTAFIRIPDRKSNDAWIDAQSTVRSAAAAECRKACRADHFRQFSWQPEFKNQNWTLLLLPIFTSYYLDDKGLPCLILINGQSGELTGMRRASVKRAQIVSIWLLISAIIAFIIGAGLSIVSLALPPVLILGIIGMIFAFLLGIGAVIPIITVWWFNRKNIPMVKSP
jgi:hypothetical protein